MKLEEILDAWDKDSTIDRTELGDTSGHIPKLHSKYLRIFVQEKMNHIILLGKLKRLRLAKHEFYTQGPSKESQSKGWKLPARGMILKNDVPMYMDADDEMAQLQDQINMSDIKINALESIMKQINNRSYIIRDMIDWTKWTGGG